MTDKWYMKLLILFLLLGSSLSMWASSGKLIKELCPFCQVQTDGTLLFPNGLDNYYKMKIIRFDRERITVSFLAATDETGKPYSNYLTFNNEAHRNRFASSLKGDCASFLGFKYYSSGLKFVEGSWRSGPSEVTKATFELTCWRKKENIIAKFFNYFDRKIDGDRSHIYDDLRSGGKELPTIRTYRVKEVQVKQR